MKKFFLFRQEAVSATSVRTSDTGLGLSVFVIPVDKLSFMTATKGEVQMVFDDATLYQESALYTGEAIEKTAVGVACTEGDELKLIDDVMKFIASDKSVSRFMRFDGASGGFTSKFVDTTKAHNVSPKIKSNPINTQTGKRSFGDSAAITANTIAGINFNYTQPFVDYNHEGLADRSDTDEVAHSNSDKWPNAGTGGDDYDIKSNVGAPFCVDPDSTDRSLSQKAVQFALGDHLIVPSVKIDHEYTIYMVISTHYGSDLFSPYFQTMYGDAAGETLGPGGRYLQDGPATEYDAGPPEVPANVQQNTKNRFSFRHSGQTGEPAVFVADSQIVQDKNEDDFNACHVFIIRRDTENNIYVQDRHGEIVAEINPPRNIDTTGIGSTSAPGATHGPLLIERLGTTEDITSSHFHKSVLARFGVIKTDIGYNESVRLADDLFQFYSK